MHRVPPPPVSDMSRPALVRFDSIVLQDQRVRGADDDYLMSVVHLTVQHPDGNWCPGCVATVRHRFRTANGGTVRVSVDAAQQCTAYVDALEPSVEHYYRDHVGSEGSAIRIGGRGASPLLIGVRRSVPASATLRISSSRP